MPQRAMPHTALIPSLGFPSQHPPPCGLIWQVHMGTSYLSLSPHRCGLIWQVRMGTSYLSPTMRVSRAGDAVDADTLVYVRA